MNFLVWCLWVDVVVEFRLLRCYYYLFNGMELKLVDICSIYCELGVMLSYNMCLGNGMEMNFG